MKTTSLSLSAAAAAVLATAIVAAATSAQARQTAAPPQQAAPAEHQSGGPGGGGPPREFPAPTNLRVLPKTLTGKQVRDIMEQWQGQLGVHCNACHTADPKNVGPNGRPRLNFADDSKPEKNAARLMYTMTNKINDDTISMVDMNMDQAEGSHEDHSEHKVTCGTCHRGHLKPEAFIPPPEHEGPPPVPAGTPRVPR